MSQRIKRWGAVAIYSSIIFLTLPYGPKIVEWVRKIIGEKGLSYSLNVVIMGVVTFFLFYLILQKKERRVSSYLLFSSIGLTYGYFFKSLDVPAERFHFLEYGLLSWLVYFSLKLDIPNRFVYLWGVVIVCIIGALDEGIQWILPNRIFDWRDVGMNGLAGVLGQGLAWLMTK